MTQTPRLHIGCGADQAVQRLEDLATEAHNLRASGYPTGTATDLKFLTLQGYHQWTIRAAQQLRNILAPAEVERLILTRRQDQLQVIDPLRHGNVVELVNLELQHCVEALGDAATSLRTHAARWRTEGELIVADTNIYLHHRLPFREILWGNIVGSRVATLVVPLAVIDELDGKKKSSDVATRARAAGRELHAMFSPSLNVEVPLNGDQDCAARLLMDPPDYQRLADTDLEIIDQAAQLAVLSGKTVHLVTMDVGMALRAGMAYSGVQPHLLPDADREPQPLSKRAERRGRLARGADSREPTLP